MHGFKSAILPEFKNWQNNCKKIVCLEMFQLIEVIGGGGVKVLEKKCDIIWGWSLLIKFVIRSYS